ncbi:MAG: hypothetical protein ACAI44_20330 [Candidatus Sericytochromatia bacterium]
MSMLNRRTQPLDPAALQALTGSAPLSPLPAPARPTTPLKQPEALLDNLAPVSTRRTDLPAQSAAISGVLTASNACDINARLSESEAELLLDVSAKLAATRDQDPAAFQAIMQALQQLSSDADGQVDFSSLDSQQQQALTALGMTPQNTRVIFHQLYQMLLPGSQQNTSSAFKKVQAQVTSFISNLDLRERTMTQIQAQARDLAAVQGVVCNLSATSIHELLKDQTDGVYDTGVSKINSQNFDIRNGIDYTLGHMVVLSQKSPETLEQVESLIQKIKKDQSLDSGEQSLLKRYGLNLNQENKLQTIDGKVLDFQAVNQLENVIFSMKDPSDGYSRVLQASASVIAQSRKLEQLGELAEKQSGQVQQITQQVVQGTQNLEQLRQDTNQIDAQLKFAQFKANHLANAMDAATGLFKSLNLDPQLLGQFNIQIVKAPEHGDQAFQFYVSGKEVSRLELLSHLGQLLVQQRTEVAGMADQLAKKKTETLTVTATLGATTQQLESSKEGLKATEEIIVKEKAVLHQLEEQREEIVKEEMPNLKPEEQQVVVTQLEPAMKAEVKLADKAADQALVVIRETLAKAETAIVHARAVQQAVADDVKVWEKDEKDARDLTERIDLQLEKAKTETAPAETRKPESAPAGSDAPPPPQSQASQAKAKADEAEIQAHVRRQEQAQAQKRNEESFLDHAQRDKFFSESLRQQQHTSERAKKDKDILDQEIKELQE